MGGVFARLALVSLVFGAGCKGDDPAQAAKSLEDPEETSENDDDLLARRDALLTARRELREKREALAQRRAKVRAEGGDTSDIDEEASALLDREEELVDREAALNAEIEEILKQRRAQLAQLAGSADDSSRVAAREGQLAAREKIIARREERLAAREDELAAREERMAQRWKESCTLGVPAAIPAPAPKGAKYDRGDVVPLLKRARRSMSRKGILRSDLPEEIRGLEKEATEAMEKGDYGRAHLAASQLRSTVRAVQINKAFIAGKFNRLNRAMRGKKLDSEQERLLKEATSDYGDGQFRNANGKLNRIYATLH